MWRVKQLSTLLVMWMVLLVVLLFTHNIRLMQNPPHHTEREFQRQANNSKTPPGENRLAQGYYNEDESEIGRKMKERRERVKAVCKKYQPYNNIMNTLLYRDYYFHNYDITVCLIAKSGSSTWRRHLRLVNEGPPANIPLEKDVYRINMLKLPENDLIAKVNSSTKIITNTAGATWQQLMYMFWVPMLHTNHMMPPDLHLHLGLKEPIDPNIKYDINVYQKLRAILMPKISFTQFIRHVVATYEINKADAHWYYRPVPLELRKKIYNIFKLDMEIYDYKLPSWFLKDV
ncbi:hypothetical protein Pcinc_039439 [Petrolisthes cinctipes]|uniref:Carbohydrate sulfotransferase n=1 Tax=Petrolisthes cinctipes TaxID=88211 RepID=A0AAE1EJI5_PETCI|nr:hypothetical protein Pcinc_039439 [Petrolisthes cinctipes]